MEKPWLEMTATHRDDGITWVTLHGSLDNDGARSIDLRFHAETAARRRPTVVDMSGVDLIVSLGIGTILACAVSLRRHGARMVLLHPLPQIEGVLLQCRVQELVPIARSEGEAIAMVQAAPAEPGAQNSGANWH